mmetsp:Transcript_26054/g.77139  ORF Transcript_26054/g.77139 Transcript_26054/m.77139 type:complete len:633 (-) Transcript_26054:276-2174(-)
MTRIVTIGFITSCWVGRVPVLDKSLNPELRISSSTPMEPSTAGRVVAIASDLLVEWQAHCTGQLDTTVSAPGTAPHRKESGDVAGGTGELVVAKRSAAFPGICYVVATAPKKTPVLLSGWNEASTNEPIELYGNGTGHGRYLELIGCDAAVGVVVVVGRHVEVQAVRRPLHEVAAVQLVEEGILSGHPLDPARGAVRRLTTLHLGRGPEHPGGHLRDDDPQPAGEGGHSPDAERVRCRHTVQGRVAPEEPVRAAQRQFGRQRLLRAVNVAGGAQKVRGGVPVKAFDLARRPRLHRGTVALIVLSEVVPQAPSFGHGAGEAGDGRQVQGGAPLREAIERIRAGDVAHVPVEGALEARRPPVLARDQRPRRGRIVGLRHHPHAACGVGKGHQPPLDEREGAALPVAVQVQARLSTVDRQQRRRRRRLLPGPGRDGLARADPGPARVGRPAGRRPRRVHHALHPHIAGIVFVREEGAPHRLPNVRAARVPLEAHGVRHGEAAVHVPQRPQGGRSRGVARPRRRRPVVDGDRGAHFVAGLAAVAEVVAPVTAGERAAPAGEEGSAAGADGVQVDGIQRTLPPRRCRCRHPRPRRQGQGQGEGSFRGHFGRNNFRTAWRRCDARMEAFSSRVYLLAI